MIPSPYNRIVKKNEHLLSSITDKNLGEYFEACFNDVVEELGLYACWVCVECMRNKRFTYGWGKKPERCPSCNSPLTYMVATFQAWASKTGEMFEWAFYHLMVKKFHIPLVKAPKECATHDFIVPQGIGIEAKGSAAYIINPDGSVLHLSRPGLMRSDTKKKAFANAKEFKQKRLGLHFYIVSNAIPEELVGYSNRDVDGVYDVTKRRQLEELVGELRRKSTTLSDYI